MNKRIEKFIEKDFPYYINLILRKIEILDRQKIVFFAFVWICLIIVLTTFKYTVSEYEYYKALADRQQTTVVKNPVSRWTIYSNNDPVWVLATSTDLSDLAIDPQWIWSKEKLITFLTDIVQEEICQNNSAEECFDNLLSFLKKNELDDFLYETNYIKTKIQEEVRTRVEKKYVDSVLIKPNLNENEIASVSKLWLDWVFLVINNLYADPTKAVQNKISKSLSDFIWMSESDIRDITKKREVRYAKFLSKLSLQIKDKIDLRITNEKNDF